MLSRELVQRNTQDKYKRFLRALRGDPLIVNTTPDLDPSQDRVDQLRHAYINVFTETIRATLGRKPGDALSRNLGRVVGIGLPLGVLVWITSYLI